MAKETVADSPKDGFSLAICLFVIGITPFYIWNTLIPLIMHNSSIDKKELYIK